MAKNTKVTGRGWNLMDAEAREREALEPGGWLMMGTAVLATVIVATAATGAVGTVAIELTAAEAGITIEVVDSVAARSPVGTGSETISAVVVAAPNPTSAPVASVAFTTDEIVPHAHMPLTQTTAGLGDAEHVFPTSSRMAPVVASGALSQSASVAQFGVQLHTDGVWEASQKAAEALIPLLQDMHGSGVRAESHASS
ncbi:hypothetical protein BC830DRAFT_1163651 [Chytriomyces sp. MP71]|nr:hypothetical protein BC830DRAFT_1163651 [Chytriomyces sp. MP71]